MFKKVLLGSTILAGAVAYAGTASAGQVGSGDNLEVKLSGFVRLNTATFGQDESAGRGRGYDFNIDDAEIRIDARNTADNGLQYGATVEMEVNTDSTKNADEVWAFVSGDFGRVEFGDQDDATDRMFLDSVRILVGRAGPDGDVADYFRFGEAIGESGADETSDATKITYFSPRFSGFQFGISHTPDDGAAGASFSERDDDGDFEKVWGVAVNFVETFGDFKVGASAGYEFGDGNVDTSSSPNTVGGTDAEDLETLSVGLNLEYGGFAFGAGYVDFGDGGVTTAERRAGADGGEYISVGAAYSSGPWGISANYFTSEKDQVSGAGGSSDADIYSLDGEYSVAPGWKLMLSANYVEAENINASEPKVDNDGHVVILSNQFSF